MDLTSLYSFEVSRLMRFLAGESARIAIDPGPFEIAIGMSLRASRYLIVEPDEFPSARGLSVDSDVYGYGSAGTTEIINRHRGQFILTIRYVTPCKQKLIGVDIGCRTNQGTVGMKLNLCYLAIKIRRYRGQTNVRLTFKSLTFK